jgi:hypothetical protein
MINGVILQKLQSLEQVLSELRSLGQVSVADLNTDWRTHRAVERTDRYSYFGQYDQSTPG